MLPRKFSIKRAIDWHKKSFGKQKVIAEFGSKCLGKSCENTRKRNQKSRKIDEKIIFDDFNLKLKFELLTQISGIGDDTTIAVLAGITHLENFKTARNLATFIELTRHFRCCLFVPAEARKIILLFSRNYLDALSPQAENFR